MSDDDLTTRFVAAFEKAAKGMRGGILAASDNLSYLVTEMFRTTPSPAAGSPQNAAVVAPSPKQGSDSGSEEIDAFPRVPSESPNFGEATAVVAYRVICPSCNNHLTGLWASPLRAEQAFSEKGGFCRTCRPSLQQYQQ